MDLFYLLTSQIARQPPRIHRLADHIDKLAAYRGCTTADVAGPEGRIAASGANGDSGFFQGFFDATRPGSLAAALRTNSLETLAAVGANNGHYGGLIVLRVVPCVTRGALTQGERGGYVRVGLEENDSPAQLQLESVWLLS